MKKWQISVFPRNTNISKLFKICCLEFVTKILNGKLALHTQTHAPGINLHLVFTKGFYSLSHLHFTSSCRPPSLRKQLPSSLKELTTFTISPFISNSTWVQLPLPSNHHEFVFFHVQFQTSFLCKPFRTLLLSTKAVQLTQPPAFRLQTCSS